MIDSIRVLESIIKDEFPNTDNLKANLMANRILDALEIVEKENVNERLERENKQNKL